MPGSMSLASKMRAKPKEEKVREGAKENRKGEGMVTAPNSKEIPRRACIYWWVRWVYPHACAAVAFSLA